jgi:uncharacterized protein
MWILAARLELHISAAESLKDKRRTLRPVVEGLRRHFNAAIAEVDGQGLWQRASIGVALVGPDAGLLEKVVNEMERFVGRRPELDVLGVNKRLYQTDDE